MFLPGMRYQDHAWGMVRKALGAAVLSARRESEISDINDFQEAVIQQLFCIESRLHGPRSTNWLGHDGFMLASDLVVESIKLPKFGKKLEKLLTKIDELSDTALRKQTNEVFSELRDELDARNFLASTEEPISANLIGCLRNTERASRATKQLLINWKKNISYSGDVLGQKINPAAEPIEIRRLEKRGRCEAGWVLRWSEFHSLYYQKDSVPNLHTDRKGCNFELNIAKWLEMTDPYNGTYSELVSISVPDVDILRTLIRLADEGNKNEDGQQRIQTKPEVADCSCERDEQQALDNDDSVGDSETESEDECYEEDISRSPCKPNVTESVDDEVKDEPESIFFDCIDHSLDLPVKVGVILKVAPDYEELLLDVLDYWGVFDCWLFPVALENQILLADQMTRELKNLNDGSSDKSVERAELFCKQKDDIPWREELRQRLGELCSELEGQIQAASNDVFDALQRKNAMELVQSVKQAQDICELKCKVIPSRKELARRLSKLRGREITPHYFDIEVKAAHESLIARVKQRLSGEGHSEGEE